MSDSSATPGDKATRGDSSATPGDKATRGDSSAAPGDKATRGDGDNATRGDNRGPGSDLDELTSWVGRAAKGLGLDPAEIPTKIVLDLARDVAHNVVRPGAPVTAYLMGLAVGRGAEVADAADRLTELAESWPPHAR